MKKHLSLLLAVLTLLLAVIPMTVLATDTSNLKITASNTSGLAVGDTFTVTLSNDQMKIVSFTGGLNFDTNYLTCKSIAKKSGYNTLANGAEVAVCSTPTEANTNGYVGVGFARTTEQKFSAADIITVTFEIKKAGNISVSGYEDSDGTNGAVIAEGSTALSTSFKAEESSSTDPDPIDPTPTPTPSGGGGCYVATAVYGSYDCPEVWTLRRFRDETLAQTWYGRAFIHTYYAISPTLVKWFGDTDWFKNMWRGTLDKMVEDLNAKGVENTPYQDLDW